MVDDLRQKAREALGVEQEVTLPFTTVVSDLDMNLAIAEQEEARDELDFSALYGMAAEQEWIVPNVLNNSFRESVTPERPLDEEDLTPELAESLTKGLTDERAIKEVLEMARSSGINMALKLADTYVRQQNSREQLASYGLKGTLATGLAAMTDPAELSAMAVTTGAVTAATGGLGTTPALTIGGLRLGYKGLKTAYNARRAFAGSTALTAVESAAFESVRDKYRYDVDGGDVMLAALLGGAVGGAGGGLSVFFAKKAKVKQLQRDKADGKELSEEEINFLEENSDDALQQRMLEDAEARNDFEEPETRLSAEEEEREVDLSFEERAALTTKQRGIAKGLRSKVSSFVRAKNSENKYTRLAADILGLNSTGNVGGKASNFSASERKSNVEMRYRLSFDRAMKYARKRYMRRTGAKATEFNVLVSRHIRGVEKSQDKDVQDMANFILDNHKRLAQEAIDADVAGFSLDSISRIPNYLPRLFNADKIRDLRKKLGSDTAFNMLVKQAILEGQPDIVKNVRTTLQAKFKAKGSKQRVTQKLIDNYIDSFAEGYARAIIRTDLPKQHGGRGVEFNVEDLRSALTFSNKLDENDVESIIDMLTQSTTVKGHKRARPRVMLNEAAEIDVEIDGEIQKLRFADLLEEDIENLHSAYTFQMASAIGLAKNGVNTNRAGSSFDNLMSRIDNEYDEMGIDPNVKEAEKQALQFMYDGITGRLGYTEGTTASTRVAARRMREYGFSVYMGMSGMSSLMEATNAILEYGIPTLLKTVPRLGNLITKTKNGQLSDTLAREMEVMSGLGGDVISGKTTRSTRYEGILEDVPYRGDYNKWDEGFGKLRETTSLLSGLSTVTAGLRRLSMYNYATQWGIAAKKGKMPFSKIKMEQLGIDANMQRRIMDQINEHSKFKDGSNTLTSINTNAWKDAEAKDIFEMSVFREATQSVQEVNIGSVNANLRSELGKTMFQFMSFTLASIEQQTMRLGVRAVNGDAAVITKLMAGSIFMGYVMYTARTHLNAKGRSDKEEYLEKRLSGTNLYKGVFQQIGAASIFQYMMEITTGAMDGNTNAITPPALSLLTNGFTSAANIAEGEMTENEYRKLFRLAPLSSLYGVRQILNQLAAKAAGN